MPDSPEPALSDLSFLRRRNALWQQLRQLQPGTPDFEALLLELSALIHWSRERVLAGLGIDDSEPPPTG